MLRKPQKHLTVSRRLERKRERRESREERRERE